MRLLLSVANRPNAFALLYTESGGPDYGQMPCSIYTRAIFSIASM